MTKHQGKPLELKELPREHVEELAPEEAEAAGGGLGILPRLLTPSPPPISPNVAPMSPNGPPI